MAPGRVQPRAGAVLAGTSSGLTALVTSTRVTPSPAGDSRSRRLGHVLLAHPVLGVLVVALVARTVFAVGASVLAPGYLVPDEQQYVELARTVVEGRSADAWAPGYGQSLYDSTRVFTGLLVAIFSVTGVSRAVAIVPVVLFGALAAAATSRLALMVLPRAYALGAGLLVALLPSQVLWSSVVLRESEVWLCLVLAALGCALAVQQRSWPRLVLALGLVSAALLGLGMLRDQTMVVATWALLAVAVLVPWRRRLAGPVATVALVAVLPWVAGLGLAGYGLVQVAVPSLATTRTLLSVGAESAIVAPSPAAELPAAGTPVPDPAAPPAGSAQVPAPAPAAAPQQDDTVVVAGPGGAAYVVEETPSATLTALPRGLVAVAVRPLPWEPATSAAAWFAKVENALWIVLYALSAIGLREAWRTRAVTAYPVVLTAGLLAVAAVTQGNLGTAFRHRGQLLWALALLAALGVHRLVQRSRARTAA